MTPEINKIFENEKRWKQEMILLREIVLQSGLKEELKWKQACYTLNGKNLLIISSFKAHCAINFFKGTFYVKIRTYSKKEKTLQAAESLALKVSNMLEGESGMPSVLLQFPVAGKKVTATGQITFDRTKFEIKYRSGSYFEDLADKMIYDEVKLDVKLVAAI